MFVILAVVALVACCLYACVYRLYLTPIAKVPGAVLAKLTYFYEFYYDVLKQGQYTWKIAELHEQYGPIIRINPHEVHVSESAFVDAVYLPSQSSRKIDKFPFSARIFGNEQAFFGTVPHEHHRIRRGPMNRFFTKTAIVQYEGVLSHHIERMLEHIHQAKRDGETLNLTQLFTAFTADVIGDYAFGEPLGVLDDKQYARDWRALWLSFISMSGVAKQIPFVIWLIRSCPTWITESIDKTMGILNRWLSTIDTRVTKRREEYVKSKSNTKVHYTLFDELLFCDLPPEEKTNSRIVDEAQSLLGAGSVSTAEVLSSLSFHVLHDDGMLPRIQEELLPVISQSAAGQPRWADLERLPYLTAVIKETLRFYYGVMQRSARVHREADLTLGEYVLPKGTPVSLSAYMIHNDRSIYGEDVDVFNPERWLVSDPTILARRDRYLHSFGKGPRMCLGVQLAWAELYLTCAAVFNPRSGFELKLHETDIEAVRIQHDFFVGYPSLKSQGVKVKVM